MCVCTRCKGSTLQGMIYLFVSFVCSTVNCRQSSTGTFCYVLRFVRSADMYMPATGAFFLSVSCTHVLSQPARCWCCNFLGLTWTHISIPTKCITKNWKFNPHFPFFGILAFAPNFGARYSLTTIFLGFTKWIDVTHHSQCRWVGPKIF